MRNRLHTGYQRAWCVEQLGAMIAESDWTQARRDVQRFVKPHELPSLELWTRE